MRVFVFVLLVYATLLHAQRPPTDNISDGHLNKVFCVSNGQCADDEVCEKLCLWTHPNGWFVGCKVLCVKRSKDVPQQPPTSLTLPPSITSTTERPRITTTTRSLGEDLPRKQIISATSVKPKIPKANGRPLQFGADFRADNEEDDARVVASGDGPFDDHHRDAVPIGVQLFDDRYRVHRQEACPPPKICDVNCGIVLNQAGCQDCQCVWQATKCTTDADCKPEEYCENGGCWCKDGFKQSLVEPGVCEPEEGAVSGPKPSQTDYGGSVSVSSVEDTIATAPPASEENTPTLPSVEVTTASGNSLPPIKESPLGDETAAPNPSPATDDSGIPTAAGELVASTPTPSIPEQTIAPVDGEVPAAPAPNEEYGTPANPSNINPPNGVDVPESSIPAGPLTDAIPPPVDENLPPTEFPPVGARGRQSLIVRLLRDLKRQKPQTKATRSITTSPPTQHWPGPCTHHQQCPPSLYCIFGECWHLPNEPVRIREAIYRQRDAVAIVPPVGLLRSRPTRPPNQKSTSTNPNNKQNYTTEFVPSGNTTTAPKLKKQPVSVVSLHRPTTIKAFNGSRRKKELGFRNVPPEIASEAFGVATDARNAVGQWISGETAKEIVDVRRAPDEDSNTTSTVSTINTTNTNKPSYSRQNDAVTEAVRLEQQSARPVFVAVYRAKKFIQDECTENSQCGARYICCRKKWCDLTVECGAAKFCLPNCWATKTTYLYTRAPSGQPLIDIVYD